MAAVGRAAADRAADRGINRRALFKDTDERPVEQDQATQGDRLRVALFEFENRVYGRAMRKEIS